MDYFELFELPVQLKIDTTGLHQKYITLSRKYHPDYFIHESGERQSEALQKTAMLNKAYKTFRDPDETLKYVLKEKQLLEEEEKYDLPPDFLMEVLEINEKLMDADEESVRKEITSRIDELQKEIYEPVKETIENFREDTTPQTALLQVKEYYYKKKYLDRIRRQLGGMA